LHSTPWLEGPSRSIAILFGVETTRMVELPDGEKKMRIYITV